MAASDTATFHAGRRIGQPKMGLPRRTSPGSHIEPIDSLAWSPLGVHIPADFPHKDILFPPAHVARPPKFVQAPLLERADIVVWTDQDPDQDQVVVGSTVLKLQQRFPLHHKPAHLLDAIDGVAHFNYFLQRANTVNPIKGVALEMHCLRSDSGPGQHENLIKDGVAQLSSEEGAQYGFAIRNTSAEAFFPYLFYFDPERYTIHVSSVVRA
ncbi:hypothetical protein K438DRAFT_411155 [Mycena galopus ATCC 62051]|nr:hypothetical protein K438DRAFT_411155 [Mycena galopus ATCC 62051]